MKPIESFFIPQDSVSDESVKIISIFKNNGEHVSIGDIIFEYETSKSIVTVETSVEGYIAYTCLENEIIPIGRTVAGVFSEYDEKSVSSWKELDHSDTEVKKNSSSAKNIVVETQYSIRAESLITEYKLDKKVFSGFDFVSAEQVEVYVGKVPTNLAKSSRISYSKDHERVVVICANNISAEMIEDLLVDDGSKVVVGYVSDSQFRNTADLEYFDSDVFEFPEKISRTEYDTVIIALGGSLKSMQYRKKVFQHYRNLNVPFTNLISKTAHVSSGVDIGVGNIIEGKVYIAPQTRIGDNNFISYSTIVGHHNTIGSHNLFAPGVTMAGLVSVGDDCIFPTGVNFIDQVKIGDRVVVPVGYNVCSDLEDDVVIKMNSRK